MRDMRVGQEAFFYHSNCKVPGITGLTTIVKEAYPDHTQFVKGKKPPEYFYDDECDENKSRVIFCPKVVKIAENSKPSHT
jgi:predicted RNA-binding protein with PUA-like domain